MVTAGFEPRNTTVIGIQSDAADVPEIFSVTKTKARSNFKFIPILLHDELIID